MQLSIDVPAPRLPEFRDGLCRCGCGVEVAGRLYLDGSHRQRAYRRRVKAEMERVGLPASPSLRAAGVTRRTTARNGDAQTARNGTQRTRSGLQVSYRKAVEAVARCLVMVTPVAPGKANEEAERVLSPALSPKQRATLEQRVLVASADRRKR